MKRHALHFVSTLALAAACVVAGSAEAQSNGPTGASEKISVGTVSILTAPVASVGGSVNAEPAAGSALALMGSAFVVTGIAQGSGETVEVIIDAVGQAGKASVKLAKSSFDKLGVSVGTSVQAVKVSTGTALVTSGKVLAFIPNAMGEALLYQERVPG